VGAARGLRPGRRGRERTPRGRSDARPGGRAKIPERTNARQGDVNSWAPRPAFRRRRARHGVVTSEMRRGRMPRRSGPSARRSRRSLSRDGGPPPGTAPRRDAARFSDRGRVRTGSWRSARGPLARVRPPVVGEAPARGDRAAHRHRSAVRGDRPGRARAHRAGALRVHGRRGKARRARARPAGDAGAMRGVRGESQGRGGSGPGGTAVPTPGGLHAPRRARRRLGRHARPRLRARRARARCSW